MLKDNTLKQEDGIETFLALSWTKDKVLRIAQISEALSYEQNAQKRKKKTVNTSAE